MSAVPSRPTASSEASLRPPRWLVAVAIGALLVSNVDDLRLLALEPDLAQAQTWARGAGLVAVMVVLVLAPFRPRWTIVPASVALLTTFVSGRLVDGLLGAAVTFFLLAATGSRRLVLALSALLLAWLVAIQALPGVAWSSLWLLVPVFFVAGGAGLLIDEFQVRHRRQMAQLADAAQAVRDRERRMLARELHDVVAHELTIITMQSSVLRMAATDAQREQARRAIEHTSRQALDELKRLVHVMRTHEPTTEAKTLLPDDDLPALTGHLAGELRRLGHDVDIDIDIDAPLPRSTRTAAGRLLREATTNVLKHAGRGADVTMRIRTDDGVLRLVVVNTFGQAPGAPALSSSRFGLAGLAERVHLLGGQFAAHREGPTEDPRWAVRASIPLRAAPGTDGPGPGRDTAVSNPPDGS